jgi:hypothetical protein
MRRCCLAIGLLCTWLAACGDDDDGGSRVSTGLPASEALSSLDEEELTTMCEGVHATFKTSLSASDQERITCTALAVPLSLSADQKTGDAAKCEMLVDRCMNGESISSATPAISFDIDWTDCEASASAGFSAQCSATVGQLEACMSALADEFDRRWAFIQCAGLKDLEKLRAEVKGMSEFDAAQLPACKALADDCPGLEFGDDDDDTEE